MGSKCQHPESDHTSQGPHVIGASNWRVQNEWTSGSRSWTRCQKLVCLWCQCLQWECAIEPVSSGEYQARLSREWIVWSESHVRVCLSGDTTGGAVEGITGVPVICCGTLYVCARTCVRGSVPASGVGLKTWWPIFPGVSIQRQLQGRWCVWAQRLEGFTLYICVYINIPTSRPPSRSERERNRKKLLVFMWLLCVSPLCWSGHVYVYICLVHVCVCVHTGNACSASQLCGAVAASPLLGFWILPSLTHYGRFLSASNQQF